MGTTGKSVARSYSRALDGLVPKKATVRSGESADGVINPIRSPGEPSYDLAMTYLTTIDPVTDQTPVEVYQEKQAAWADAQEEWDQAKLAAQKRAQSKYPKDPVKQRQDYDEWNQANFRKVGHPDCELGVVEENTNRHSTNSPSKVDGWIGYPMVINTTLNSTLVWWIPSRSWLESRAARSPCATLLLLMPTEPTKSGPSI